MTPNSPEIVLVNPQGWRFIGDGTVPSGLLAVAAALVPRYRVTLIDQRVDRGWRARLACALRRRPLLVGVSSMTGKQILDGLRISARVRREAPDVPVVWGGVHASLLPEQTVAHPAIDYVVAGEGEHTLSALADDLAAGGTGAGIPGLWHALDGAPASAGPRPPLDAAELPRMPYELLDLERYVRRERFGRTLSLFSSRGCPFRCSFCYNVAFFGGARWKPLPARGVADEVIELARRHRLDHVQFLDDNFFVHRPRVLEIGRALAASGLGLRWSVLGGHVKNLVKWSVDELHEMHGCGLREVLIGAESGSQRILDAIEKDYRLDELFTVNRRLAEAGVQPTYSFMSGLPGETEDELRETIQAMFRLKREHPDAIMGNIKPFLPYPGTALYEESIRRGFDPPTRLEDWAGFASYNYGRLRIRWLSLPERLRRIWLYYATVLMSPEYLFVRSPVFRLVARIASPAMRRDVERFDFGRAFMPRLMRFVQSHVL